MIDIQTVGIAEPDDLARRIKSAQSWVSSTRCYLRDALDEDMKRDKLLQCIEDHARALARVEVLQILNSEDFFIAMARSASKIGSS